MKLIALVATLLLAVASPAGTAAAQAGEGCAEGATVRWNLDLDPEGGVGVAEAFVTVPGCADGDTVGFRLFTDDGPVPADDVLRGELSGGQAVFDVSAERLTIAEVTGVFVGLVSDREIDAPTEPGDESPRVEETPLPADGGEEGSGRLGRLADTGRSILDLVLVALALIVIGWGITSRKDRPADGPEGDF